MRVMRRVLLEQHHEIDRGERAQHGGARLLVLDRPRRPLEAHHRGVAVEPDHQPVALRARLRQQRDMAGMQQVEAAIGEADAQPVAPPARDMVERQRQRQQLARGQRVAVDPAPRPARWLHHGGADLADDDAGRDIGEPRRVRHRGAGGERRRQHRDHRVAGAGDVEDLARLGVGSVVAPDRATSIMPSWLSDTSTAPKPCASISARAAAMTSAALPTGSFVASPSSRRLGFSTLAPR